MCIAIVCKKGVAIPSEAILRNCFENNPNGAGFAFNLNGRVIIKKGFMKENDFIEAIKEHDQKYNLKARGVLIHTRITTQGGTNQAMTHPFPIVADEGALKKIEYISDYAVIHNGIISMCSGFSYKKEETMSDTALFIRDYLSKIASNDNWFENQENVDLIEKLIDSKMAILRADGEIIMTGGFHANEKDGNYYSNTSYEDSYFRIAYRYYDAFGDDNWTAYKEFNKGSATAKGTKGTSTSRIKDYLNAEEEELYEGESILAMSLKKGQTIMFSDGIIMDYDPKVKYFLTEDDDIYCTYEYNEFFVYLGTGEIYEANSVKKLDFKADALIKEDDIASAY